MANEDKKRALDAAIAKLEKDFGKGTVMRSRFCCRTGSEAGDRRRYGRQPCRTAGKTDVPGTS